jgi:putative tricarboxylic transport membrane protein
MPFIGVICLVGVYSVRNAIFDVWIMIIAGVIGYFMRTKWNFPVASFIIGVVLGPMTENSVRQTLMMFKGDMTRIFNRPIALTFLFVTLAFIVFKISYPFLRRKFIAQKGSTS